METKYFTDLVFKHLVELSNTHCLFCSTEERSTGKKRLYLIFGNNEKMYLRNGMRGTWDEVKNESEYQLVRDGLKNAFEEKNIPCYTTA